MIVTQWNKFVEANSEDAVVDFALKLSNFAQFERDVQRNHELVLEVRRLRNKGTVRARQLARKSLKRRNILNKFNLVKN
jgi:hypothetical protein